MSTRRRPSMRLLVGVIVVAPLLTVCAVLVTLSTITSRHIAQHLGDSYVESAATSVSHQVGSYLVDAVRVSQQYVRRIARGELPTHGLTAWETTMLDDMTTTPAIASICFGNMAGETTWLLRNKGRLEVGRVTGPRQGQAVEFVMHGDGTMEPQPIRRYLYDPRVRPWWKVAIDRDAATWTPIYFWFGETALDGTASTGYTRPVRDAQGEVLGVLIVDVTLGDIGGFLSQLAHSTRGYYYIIDEQNMLVATSHGTAIGADGHRIDLAHHPSDAAKIADEAMGQSSGHDAAHTARLRHNNEAAKVHVAQLKPFNGIDWRLVTVLPESVFLSDAAAALQRGIMLSLAAIVAGVLLALMLARQVTSPLLLLARHVRRVGEGDFDTPLNLEASRELSILSDAINHMARGLKHRMELQEALAVAQQVQQSLLPEGDPACPHLDLVGRSRYCDETGGDYYDFIAMQRAGKATNVCAIGDVMGHGIAAALLMTSARAALRVHSVDEPHLGRLLTRVNRLLAEDARHGAFMTMALVEIDVPQSRLTWSSAGHALPLVYHPEADRFASLQGSNIPLGVLGDVTYEEFHYDRLTPSTVVLLSTDGVWETTDPQGQMFGRERMQAILRHHHSKSAMQIADEIERALRRFAHGQPARDDITFVVAKVLHEDGPLNPSASDGRPAS